MKRDEKLKNRKIDKQKVNNSKHAQKAISTISQLLQGARCAKKAHTRAVRQQPAFWNLNPKRNERIPKSSSHEMISDRRSFFFACSLFAASMVPLSSHTARWTFFVCAFVSSYLNINTRCPQPSLSLLLFAALPTMLVCWRHGRDIFFLTWRQRPIEVSFVCCCL